MRCKTLVDDGRKRDRARARRPARQAAHAARRDAGRRQPRVVRSPTSTEHELANPQAARALYDRIPADYPKSGLRDDARWHARAAVARARRSARAPSSGCARCSRRARSRSAPAATSRSGSTTRSSSSARSCATTSHDLPGAAAAFRQLPKDYPASILRDDALYELAVTLAQARTITPGACRAIAELQKQSARLEVRRRRERARRGAAVSVTRAGDPARTTCTSATAGATCSPASRSTSRAARKLGLIGPAASGKSVILQARLRARAARPRRRSRCSARASSASARSQLGDLRQRIGMLFQNYALFDFLDGRAATSRSRSSSAAASTRRRDRRRASRRGCARSASPAASTS